MKIYIKKRILVTLVVITSVYAVLFYFTLFLEEKLDRKRETITHIYDKNESDFRQLKDDLNDIKLYVKQLEFSSESLDKNYIALNKIIKDSIDRIHLLEGIYQEAYVELSLNIEKFTDKQKIFMRYKFLFENILENKRKYEYERNEFKENPSRFYPNLRNDSMMVSLFDLAKQVDFNPELGKFLNQINFYRLEHEKVVESLERFESMDKESEMILLNEYFSNQIEKLITQLLAFLEATLNKVSLEKNILINGIDSTIGDIEKNLAILLIKNKAESGKHDYEVYLETEKIKFVRLIMGLIVILSIVGVVFFYRRIFMKMENLLEYFNYGVWESAETMKDFSTSIIQIAHGIKEKDNLIKQAVCSLKKMQVFFLKEKQATLNRVKLFSNEGGTMILSDQEQMEDTEVVSCLKDVTNILEKSNESSQETLSGMRTIFKSSKKVLEHSEIIQDVVEEMNLIIGKKNYENNDKSAMSFSAKENKDVNEYFCRLIGKT